MNYQIQITGPRGSGKTSFINQFGVNPTLSLLPGEDSFNYVPLATREYILSTVNNKKELAIHLFKEDQKHCHIHEGVANLLISLFREKKYLARLIDDNCISFNLLEDQVTEYTRGHIVMMDTTDMFGLENTERYLVNLKRQYNKNPIVICGNKVDSKDRIIFTHQIVDLIQKHPGVIYFEISGKTGSQLDRPLLMLARMIANTQYRYYQTFKKSYGPQLPKGLVVSSTIRKSPIDQV